MSNHQPNNYFDSINDFLDNGHRLLVLHEVNNKEPNIEEFFLLLNKKSINSKNENTFKRISEQSYSQINSLSKATQLFITNKNDELFFIHLTSMPYDNNKKELIKQDQQDISDNFRTTLTIAFPELIEEAKNELTSSHNRSVRVPDIKEEATEQLKTAFQEIKKDTHELVSFTKKFIEEKTMEANMQIKQSMDDAKPLIENLNGSKEKLFQISSSIKEGILKQHKIFQKMRKWENEKRPDGLFS